MIRHGVGRFRGASPTALWRHCADVDWRGVAAFGLPFILYLRTLAPTIYNLDSAELTTAAATGGLTRATGYPLYLMLGYLWSWLPAGDVGYRMNLFSACCGALTIALAERILRRLGVGAWAAFGALGLLACATYFWAFSLVAEVYTLQTALTAGLVLLLLRWAERPTPWRLAAVGLAGGACLSHHGASVLLIPGCVWYVATVAPRRAFAPKALLLALGALLLGLSCYLYLPLRYAAHPAFNYAGRYDATGAFLPIDLQTPSGLWWLVSGRAFSGEMLAYGERSFSYELRQFGVQLWRAFFGIGIGPGLLGLVVLLRRNWRLGGMLLLLFAAHVVFFVDYRVGDKDTMFLPAYLVWAIWLGVGYQWLLDWLARESTMYVQRAGVWFLRALLVGAVCFAMMWNWSLVDASSDWSARIRGERILRALQPHALVFGWWDTVPLIEYLQLVEGQRPDVQAINRFIISPAAMHQLITQEAGRRPVYVDSLPDDVSAAFEAHSAGPVYQLVPRAMQKDPAHRRGR